MEARNDRPDGVAVADVGRGRLEPHPLRVAGRRAGPPAGPGPAAGPTRHGPRAIPGQLRHAGRDAAGAGCNRMAARRPLGARLGASCGGAGWRGDGRRPGSAGQRSLVAGRRAAARGGSGAHRRRPLRLAALAGPGLEPRRARLLGPACGRLVAGAAPGAIRHAPAGRPLAGRAGEAVGPARADARRYAARVRARAGARGGGMAQARPAGADGGAGRAGAAAAGGRDRARAGARPAARLPGQPAAVGGRDAALLPPCRLVGLTDRKSRARALLRRPGCGRLRRRGALRPGADGHRKPAGRAHGPGRGRQRIAAAVESAPAARRQAAGAGRVLGLGGRPADRGDGVGCRRHQLAARRPHGAGRDAGARAPGSAGGRAAAGRAADG